MPFLLHQKVIFFVEFLISDPVSFDLDKENKPSRTIREAEKLISKNWL